LSLEDLANPSQVGPATGGQGPKLLKDSSGTLLTDGEMGISSDLMGIEKGGSYIELNPQLFLVLPKNLGYPKIDSFS
jgi:hypothetical protein